MEEILIIILTSSLVSGLVTLVLSHLFENRRYLREQKLKAFNTFLDMLYQFLQMPINDADKEKIDTFASRPILEIERAAWNVKILSNNSELGKICEAMVADYRELTENVKKFSKLSKTEQDRLRSLHKRQSVAMEKFINEAGKEVNSLF